MHGDVLQFQGNEDPHHIRMQALLVIQPMHLPSMLSGAWQTPYAMR